MKVIRVTAKDYANLPKGANSQNLSRYNVVSFLPKFLFQQLSQLSTLYFLGIALLQQIPDLSPTGNQSSNQKSSDDQLPLSIPLRKVGNTFDPVHPPLSVHDQRNHWRSEKEKSWSQDQSTKMLSLSRWRLWSGEVVQSHPRRCDRTARWRQGSSWLHHCSLQSSTGHMVLLKSVLCTLTLLYHDFLVT